MHTSRLLPLLLLAISVSGVESAERSPAEWLSWFAEQWDESSWTAGNQRGRYMRPLDDTGWKARMKTLQGLVSAGQESIPALQQALESEHTSTRILAAQTLGYLAPGASKDVMLRRLSVEKDAATRLYLVDSISMQGGASSRDELSSWRKRESNGDVKRHVGYALERGGEGLDGSISATLLGWKRETMAASKLGAPAPDFVLQTVSGKSVRLSDYRGKRAVVLVFVYGDT